MPQVPVNLTTNDAKQQYPNGFIYEDFGGDKKYAYVQFDNGSGNVTAVAGAPVGWLAARPGGKVTNDLSDAAAVQVCGILMAALTDQYWGWIQIKGKGVNALTTDSTVADGSLLGWSADSTVAPTTTIGEDFGVATADDTGTTLAAGDYYLDCRGW